MRAAAACLALTVFAAACGGGPLFGKVYEYEEDLYLSLDGSADLIINASIPALVSLRGLELNPDPSAQFDREKIRELYQSPLTDVTRVSRPWRRNGRRYVQIRLSVGNLQRLSEVAPFSWSTYELAREGRFPVPVIRAGRKIIVPTRALDRLLGVEVAPTLAAEHATPGGGRRGCAKPQEAQGCFDDNGIAKPDRSDNQNRGKDVGEDRVHNNAPG